MSTYLRETVIKYRGQPKAFPAPMASSRDAVPALRKIVDFDVPKEQFAVVAMDNKNRPIGWEVIAVGGLTVCPVAVSAVFRGPMIAGAYGVILCHNHPSGDPTPSADDISLTERICQAGAILGIRVLDHIILGHPATDAPHFSFLDAGLLPRQES